MIIGIDSLFLLYRYLPMRQPWLQVKIVGYQVKYYQSLLHFHIVFCSKQIQRIRCNNRNVASLKKLDFITQGSNPQALSSASHFTWAPQPRAILTFWNLTIIYKYNNFVPFALHPTMALMQSQNTLTL